MNRWLKDNYCRSQQTQLWVEQGGLFPPSIWPPLHFYFIRFLSPVVNWDYVKAGELASVVAASFLSVFFYFFCRLRLHRELSLLSVLLLSACWPFLEFSTMGASEPFHLFLSFTAFYFLLRSNYWLAGVFLGMGALVRVEGWALLFFFLGFGFLLSLVRSISWKDYGKLTASSLSLFAINYFHYYGNLLGPFEVHYKAQQVDKVLRQFSGLNWESVSRISSAFGGGYYSLFLVFGFVGFLLWEKKKEWAWVCALGIFVVTLLKLIGVATNEVLPEARYFFLFFLGGLPFALFFWKQWVPKKVLRLILLLFSLVMFFQTIPEIRATRGEKFEPDYNSASKVLRGKLGPSDQLLIGVKNYDYCWFAMKSGLPISKTTGLLTRRDRMIHEIQYKGPSDFENLIRKHQGTMIILEKGTRYESLVEEHMEQSQTEPLEFRLKRTFDNGRFEIYWIEGKETDS